MITLSIDLTKLNRSLIREVTKKDGTTAKFLNLVLWPSKDDEGNPCKDRYDNDGFVKQALTKAEREAKIDTAILGNYQVKEDFAPKTQKPQGSKPQASKPQDDSDLPF